MFDVGSKDGFLHFDSAFDENKIDPTEVRVVISVNKGTKYCNKDTKLQVFEADMSDCLATIIVGFRSLMGSASSFQHCPSAGIGGSADCFVYVMFNCSS